MEDYELANRGITLLTTTGKCNHLGIEITIPFTSSRMYVILKFRFFVKTSSSHRTRELSQLATKLNVDQIRA